ncbi:hypothetical protein AAG747_19645 [Rapidithrix thailandica]|uniref:Uncharacterized protein n=1 Tax=Rapidithrix thailandica TaxID=413964 RepID=A0AAW9SFV3_9BACT
MKKFYLGISALVYILILSNTALASKMNDNPKVVVLSQPYSVSDDAIMQILQAIPSPLEISMLIKELGTVYNKTDLNNSDFVSKYNTSFKKALNLGVYGTDLGFANIYSKNQDALNYLSSVKKLADGLSIGQFFDYQTIKKLAESANNFDELLMTTTSNFEKINYHLSQQGRDHLSILLLTGGWIEALHITTIVQQRSKHEDLKVKIAEQKIVLDQILKVLQMFKTKPEFPGLISDLNELKKVYNEISIETTYGQPTTQEVNGMLVVMDNNSSTVKVTDAQIDKITSLIRSVRNKIIR